MNQKTANSDSTNLSPRLAQSEAIDLSRPCREDSDLVGKDFSSTRRSALPYLCALCASAFSLPAARLFKLSTFKRSNDCRILPAIRISTLQFFAKLP